MELWSAELSWPIFTYVLGLDGGRPRRGVDSSCGQQKTGGVQAYCRSTKAVREEPLVNVACLGDSNTTPQGGNYATLLQKAFLGDEKLSNLRDPRKSSKKCRYEVRAFGKGGSTAGAGRQFYGETEEFRRALAHAADVYVVMLGTNDAMRRGGVPSRAEEGLSQIIDAVRAANGQSEILLVLPPGRSEQCRLRRNLTETVHPLVREVAAKKRCALVVPAIEDDASSYRPDGVHLSQMGAEAVARAVKNALCELECAESQIKAEAACGAIEDSPSSSRPLEHGGPPFEYVLSLGSWCLGARLLKETGLRLYSGPFDWIYASAEVVTVCVSDDFATLMDASLIDGKEHRVFGPMQFSSEKAIIFPHHEPKDADRRHFERCCARFSKIADKRGARKLFVGTYLESSRGGSSLKDLKSLFAALLATGIRNFDFLALYIHELAAVDSGPELRLDFDSRRTDGMSGDTTAGLAVHTLLCRGRLNGLYFKEADDENCFRKWLLFHENGDPRAFDLRKDPLNGSGPAAFAEVPNINLRKSKGTGLQYQPKNDALPEQPKCRSVHCQFQAHTNVNVYRGYCCHACRSAGCKYSHGPACQRRRYIKTQKG